MILLAASNDSNRMVVRNGDFRGSSTRGRWDRDDAHSAARKPGLRPAHVHYVVIVVHMRREHTRRGRTPRRPWRNKTSIRWSRVRLRPHEQRLGMHMYFSVFMPPVHACRIELRDDSQRYHAIVGIRVEEAWHRCFRVYPCCERVAVEGDAADGFKFVTPDLGDG